MLAAKTWGLVILGALVVAGGAYVQGRSDGRAIEVAERATLEEVARESRDAALQAAAEAIAKISVTHTTIRQKAEVTIREKPVYRDCVNDPDVVGMLDAARENRPLAEPIGGGELPGIGPRPTHNLW
jgi:hypothetical protein